MNYEQLSAKALKLGKSGFNELPNSSTSKSGYSLIQLSIFVYDC